MLGCDQWGYELGRPFGQHQIHKRDLSDCNHPNATGWIAVVYCIGAVVFGAQVLITLFIGSTLAALIKYAVAKPSCHGPPNCVGLFHQLWRRLWRRRSKIPKKKKSVKRD